MKTIEQDAQVIMQSKFKVIYALTTFKNSYGSIVLLPEKILEKETDSEDFYHAFVELSDRHKYDQICSLRILEINKIGNSLVFV